MLSAIKFICKKCWKLQRKHENIYNKFTPRAARIAKEKQKLIKKVWNYKNFQKQTQNSILSRNKESKLIENALNRIKFSLRKKTSQKIHFFLRINFSSAFHLAFVRGDRELLLSSLSRFHQRGNNSDFFINMKTKTDFSKASRSRQRAIILQVKVDQWRDNLANRKKANWTRKLIKK